MGGLENGVINIINRSDPDAFDHAICCLTRSGAAAHRLARKVKIVEMHKREGNDWRVIPRLIRFMRSQRPHIVHTRNWGTVDGILAARFAGVPSVIHGEHGWNMNDPEGQSRRRLWLRRFLGLGVGRFVTVSDDIRRWLENVVRVPDRKVQTIRNGVDTEKFHPRLRDEKGLGTRSEGGIVIGTVGRLDPIKRQDLLLQAFSKLDPDARKVKLLLAGEGPERKRLETLRDGLPGGDRISFLGEREDVPELYRIMDIFVLPSRNEGMSNTILEAMASGLPVIATAVGGNPELVRDGRTGILIAPDSVDAIRDAIQHYVENPEIRRIHGANAREEAVDRFSLKRMVEEYENLYRDACYQRRRI
jgi:sugar transferase (PEP-CTERM/EpsH1 system associated)